MNGRDETEVENELWL